mmetsp:Transcript_31051/g.75054  ORF Transcript_31051/g.75054 Transcript_31051/m.75054 type:complete len:242 (+) Transcript_31051:444-1169(+)
MHGEYAYLHEVCSHGLAFPQRHLRLPPLDEIRTAVRALAIAAVGIQYVIQHVLPPLPPQRYRTPSARLADVDRADLLQIVKRRAHPDLHPFRGVALVQVEVHVQRDRGHRLPPRELYIHVVRLQAVALPVRVERRVAELVDAVPRLGSAQRPRCGPADLADRGGDLGIGEQGERGGGFEAEVAVVAGRTVGIAAAAGTAVGSPLGGFILGILGVIVPIVIVAVVVVAAILSFFLFIVFCFL